MATAAFALVLVIAVPAGRLPWLALGVYAVLSLVTFIAYAADKSAARQGRWRTPEAKLHVLALCGGWPGALLAQGLLRHKSSKASFRSAFALTVVANCLALGALLSPQGSALLRSIGLL